MSMEFPLLKEFTGSSQPDRPMRVLGIDLGTTNSTVAEIVYDPASSNPVSLRCIEIPQQTKGGVYTNILVPSVVALIREEIVVGEGAKRAYAQQYELGLRQDESIFLECKNEIGTNRTYHRAPQGLTTPAEISGHILRFLRDAATNAGEFEPSRVIVTVPASFQSGQRQDTVRAAELAGLKVSSGDLLDEPIAAFIDYLMSHLEDLTTQLDRPRNLLVFDFGGGTCDIAVLRIKRSDLSGFIDFSPLAVSRYHRLGGGDIDRVILYDILIPQLLEQNGISAEELEFEDKKKFIEPALTSVAESLKIGLCNEINRLKQFGRTDFDHLEKVSPGSYDCAMKDRVLKLKSPRLSYMQFNKVLEPFVDQDFLYAHETEYYLTNSIFAPLQDALDRSQLNPSNIELCLVVGGSSLIPQIIDSIGQFLPNARLLAFEDREYYQVAVARGAAYHALSLALAGRPIFRPVSQDSISIMTSSREFRLIEAGLGLPFPGDFDWAESRDLAVPKTSGNESVDLRVEILRGSDKRIIFRKVWEIPPPVAKGTPLLLKYRMDENQVLSLNLMLNTIDESESQAHIFAAQIENPLTNVVNPNKVKERILQAEQDLRLGAVPPEDIANKIVSIASDYSELNQNEKAIYYLKQALMRLGGADGFILNRIALCYDKIGDLSKAEKFYKESCRSGDFAGAYFNTALFYRRRNKYESADENVQRYLEIEPDGPGYTLRALIARDMNNEDLKNECLAEALELFAPVSVAVEWELGWMLTAAEMAGEKELAGEARTELKRRTSRKRTWESHGELPDLLPK